MVDVTTSFVDREIERPGTAIKTFKDASGNHIQAMGLTADDGSFVPSGGTVSPGNSTTAALGADAIFTGAAEDITHYSSISLTYAADVAAAASGLSMEFSPDGTNWDRKLIGSLAAETKQTHGLKVINNFFRVVYTNGSVAQTAFRLQVICHSSAQPFLVNRAGQPQGTIDCSLVRQTSDIHLDFARKHIPGGRSFFFFGHNDSVGTVYEDIHPESGDINWLSVATKVEVLSTDAADTLAGLGLRQVEIHGLSATGADQVEIIDMNGTTAVESSLTYMRINKIHSESVGTYGGSHQGDIICRVTGGGSTITFMMGEEGSVDTSVQYGLGEAPNGYWSVPLGKVLYIRHLSVNVQSSGNNTADVILYEREGILDSSPPYGPRRVIWNRFDIQGSHPEPFTSNVKIKQLTDLWFRAKASNGTVRIDVKLHFHLLDQDADGA